MKKLIAIIGVLFGINATLNAQDRVSPYYPMSVFSYAYSPKYETRAVWLTTLFGLDWPHTKAISQASMLRQKEELCLILDSLQAAGINTVMFQSRIRATTIYPSDIEPFDECLTGKAGKSPMYDPLGFAIEQCHKRGMELHAWVVALPIGKWASYGCQQLRKRHKNLIVKIDGDAYLDPGQQATASYIANICTEITSRYDIDGIHLDYLRYPETWTKFGNKNTCRNNISAIASTISHRVKAIKPWIKISCSPIGKYDDLPRHSSRGWNARSRVCQDAQLWLNNGTMDQLYPMLYFRGENFYPFAADWQQSAPQSGSIIAGLGAYMIHPSQQNWPIGELTRQMYVSRTLGEGQCYFRSSFFTGNTKGIYSFAASEFYKQPALVPPINNPNSNVPNPPSNLALASTGDTLLLTWTAAAPQGYAGADLTYTLYSDFSYPVDINNPQNIVATRLNASRIAIAHPTHNMYYAVTAIDRFGTESRACQLPSTGTTDSYNAQENIKKVSKTTLSHRSSTPLLRFDGDTLILLSSVCVTDIALLQIVSPQGRIVYTIPYNGQSIITKRLSPGIYHLNSISRKKKYHRLGTIIVPIKE